jgi:hypothetical protein
MDDDIEITLTSSVSPRISQVDVENTIFPLPLVNNLAPESTNSNSKSLESIMLNQSRPLIVGCVTSTLIYLILNADCKINPGKKDCSNNISPLISIPAGVGAATSLVGVHLEKNCPQLYQRMKDNWSTLIDFFSIRRERNSQTQTPRTTLNLDNVAGSSQLTQSNLENHLA